jgi:hypothetical protein
VESQEEQAQALAGCPLVDKARLAEEMNARESQLLGRPARATPWSLSGLGQQASGLPTDGDYNIRMSDQQVASQAECASKGGQLFDSQRFCCVKYDGKTGQPSPKLTTGYGWFCAQTTFGAPAAKSGTTPGTPGAPGQYPPYYSSSMMSSFGNMSEWIPLAAVGGLLLLVATRRS